MQLLNERPKVAGASLSNTETVTNVDIEFTTGNGKKISADAQYSEIYVDRLGREYLDIRLDVLSACVTSDGSCDIARLRNVAEQLRERSCTSNARNLRAFMEESSDILSVRKYGKILSKPEDNNCPDQLLVAFFNKGQLADGKSERPRLILALDVVATRNWLEDNWVAMIQRRALKFNDKASNGLDDRAGSAFLALPIAQARAQKLVSVDFTAEGVPLPVI